MRNRDVDRALEIAFAEAGHPRERSARHRGPHFALKPESAPAETQAGFAWPETVLALEAAHASRFELLAKQLLEAREQRHIKVLLFTSAHRAEGRTTLVLTLARTVSRMVESTLLVDADLAAPMMARRLGLSPHWGLDDVVQSDIAPAEAIVHSPADRLSVLPLRAAVENPRAFLASPAWACLMARFRREYDLVLLDGSPLFAGLSAALLHRSVDAAVLVFHRGVSNERALERACEVVEAGGVPLLGLAETFV